MTVEIAVLVPVLGRPRSAQPLVDSLAASTDRARLVFVVSEGDRGQELACVETGVAVFVAGWEPGRADYARKLNYAFAQTREPFVFTGADDLDFQPGWADAALSAIEGFQVCGTNDDANPMVKRGRHSTHSLVRRSYIEDPGASWDGPGTLLSEAYDHQWTDTELVNLAMHRGVWTFAGDAVVRHRHPFYSKGVELDDTYRKALANGRADSRLYQQRRKEWSRG